MCYSHFGNGVRYGANSIIQWGFINDCYKGNPVGQWEKNLVMAMGFVDHLGQCVSFQGMSNFLLYGSAISISLPLSYLVQTCLCYKYNATLLAVRGHSKSGIDFQLLRKVIHLKYYKHLKAAALHIHLLRQKIKWFMAYLFVCPVKPEILDTIDGDASNLRLGIVQKVYEL